MTTSEPTRLVGDDLTREILEGGTIYGPDGERIGTVSHLHGAGAGVLVVIDVGSWLGLSSKRVAVPALDMAFMRNAKGQVYAEADWTKDELKAMPDHED